MGIVGGGGGWGEIPGLPPSVSEVYMCAEHGYSQ